MLKISVRSADAHVTRADVIVVAVFQLEGKKVKKVGGKIKPDPLAPLDRALGGGLAKVIAAEDFKGKKDQTLVVSTLGRLSCHKLVLMGLGDPAKMTDADVRTFGCAAAKLANAEKAKSLAVALPEALEGRLRTVAEGIELGAYRFTRYFTGSRKPKAEIGQVSLLVRNPPKSAKRDVEVGQRVAEGVNLARDLSNEPPNVMTPAALADSAVRIAKERGMKSEVFDMKEIIRRGMKLIQAVGQGSAHEPRLVHVTYDPGKRSKKRIVFVGKGLTFDSGGLSIKPAAGMGEMKHDMSGAANMVGLMAIVGALKPDVEVHFIMACAENMPDGNAYRPGDIWGSLEGKSVEIINTDAEGRLVLADALTYAARLKPDVLVDNATLTGACVVALGNGCSGYYASNDDVGAEFAQAIGASGEKMWRMPLLEELKDQLKSDCADLKHTGDRMGGSISAALFLREFIGDTKNWVHCDIAGPAMGDRPRGWDPKGGTGHGVLTFHALIERAAAAPAPAEER